ncbi:hypothetical protein PAEPH01_2393 [Pancytospora epiphaga]|nr:hypothetical protein PAEPH01_2393 [Pancytospora epiphaga]
MLLKGVLLLGLGECFMGAGSVGAFSPIGNSYNANHGTPEKAQAIKKDIAEDRDGNGRGLPGSCNRVFSGRCTTDDGRHTFKEMWGMEEPEYREFYKEDSWISIPSTKIKYIKHHGLRVNPDIINDYFSDDSRYKHRHRRTHK